MYILSEEQSLGQIFKELIIFTKKNIKAAIFGFYIVALIFTTEYIPMLGLHRYDVIFVAVLLFQIFLITSKRESISELKVIFSFHLVATVMELFKTSADIGSWSYPAVGSAFFALATVPLFTGFLYSAVGSYISRAIKFFDMCFVDYPKLWQAAAIAAAIYINFFTHHFIYDFRYFIFVLILILFWRTKIHFKIIKHTRKMPFIIAGFLSAFFVWLVENFASYMNIWLYPDQVEVWKMVSVQKIGSWFLLLIVSFVLVSLVYKERLIKKEGNLKKKHA